ncbi:MAG: DUF1501 domain-containing protein [Planctomycetaceae bacterium]
MFDLRGSAFRNCDRVTRRSVLKVGALLWGGFSLPDLLRSRAAAGESTRSQPTAVIQIFCGGGPSHIDMYDLKPHAPAEIRGEFREISTSVPGIRICEHLPLQAEVMDKFAVIRSVQHGTSSHLPAAHQMLTGYETGPSPVDNTSPFPGSVVARLRGSNVEGMPAYVAVPRKVAFGSASYAGAAYSPFITDVEPNAKNFRVRSLKLEGRMNAERLGGRRNLLASLDTFRRDVDLNGDLAGLDAFYQEAVEMITSDRAAKAFDIEKEDPKLRDEYGRTSIGQNCLLARRLVEAGVTYVTCLSGGGWDTHFKNFNELKDVSLPRYDRAIATLLKDLHARGLDKRVLVMAFGEFGRTPRINKEAGRDHWPGAMSVVMGGGGLKVGQMVGSTDSRAAFPATKPHTPGDVLSTMYHVMGIDPRHELRDHNGRPLPILSEGRPIADLV